MASFTLLQSRGWLSLENPIATEFYLGNCVGFEWQGFCGRGLQGWLL